MAEKRKTVMMMVAVSVPREVTAQQTRMEVRSLIKEAANHTLNPGDVRLVSVKSMPKPRRYIPY